MVAAAKRSIFEEGIYTVDQAAHLARLAPRSLKRWLDGEGETEPALIRRIPKNDAQVVGFLDLVQALAIRAIRNAGKLSLQKIRQTIIEAEKLGVQYPFARDHKTFVFSDDVVIEIEGHLYQVTGKYRRQQLIRPVVEIYLQDLTFDSRTGLANEYVPMRDADSDARVVIKPTLKFGAPVIMPRGYTVGALVNAVGSEGSIQAAADMFDVPRSDITLALRYEDYLAGTAQ